MDFLKKNFLFLLILLFGILAGINIMPSSVSAGNCQCSTEGAEAYATPEPDSVQDCCQHCNKDAGEEIRWNGSVTECSETADSSREEEDDNNDGGSGGSTSDGTSSSQARLENPLGDNIDTPQELIRAVINGVMGVIGILAVAALVYGGILYLTSAGNEEQAGRAKKAITYAVIGLLVSLLSYAIVNTVIRTIGG